MASKNKVKKQLPKSSVKKESAPVVTSKTLTHEEPLDTLVRLPFAELIGLGMEKVLQNLTVLAIGKKDSGNFKIDNLVVQLAGVIHEDIVFRIAGTIKEYDVVTGPGSKKINKKK